MSDNQVPTPLSAEVVARRLPSEAPYWKLAESHELLRAQLAAKDLRIAELTRPPEVEDWKQLVALAYQSDNEGARRIFNITSEFIRVREERDRLLDEREAILAKLPPDSPCKHAETGHSVADDVADLVRERDMLLGKPDAVHLGAQAAVTALRQCQAIQAQLAASEAARTLCMERIDHLELRVCDVAGERDTERAARKKAEEERDQTQAEFTALDRRLSAMVMTESDRADALSQGLEKAAKRAEEIGKGVAKAVLDVCSANGRIFGLECQNTALRQGLEAAANAFGAAGSIAEKLYGRVRSFIDESVPGWISGDDGPAYPLLNLSQFCNRSGAAARALLQENPATDNPSQALRDRMDQNSKFVEQMPDWVKGSPVNARPVERPIQVGDTVRQKVHGWTAIVKSIQPDPVYGGFAIFEEPGGFWRLSQLDRVEDGKP